jgi:tripartite-type tricarboxylate transporter receptor subunit TctC
LTYLDPDRKATYGRKNFIPIAFQTRDSMMVAVAKDSPYKTLQDLVDAAKAKPGQITMSGTGVGGIAAFTNFEFERKAGVKFRWVANQGQQDAIFNLVGGHVDAVADTAVGSYVSAFKAGDVRLLATCFADEENFPGVPTFQSLGYDVEVGALRGMSALAGTPEDVLIVLDKAWASVQSNPDFKQALRKGGQGWIPLMDRQAASKYWDKLDANLKDFIPEMKAAK